MTTHVLFVYCFGLQTWQGSHLNNYRGHYHRLSVSILSHAKSLYIVISLDCCAILVPFQLWLTQNI